MLKITTCLDHSGGGPVISTPPNLAGRAPAGYLTGFYGTRDHNALTREAMLECRRSGWPFQRADIHIETRGFGPERQGWEEFRQGCSVLNLFTAKKEVESDLAALLEATAVRTAGMLDRQTLRKVAADPDWGLERLFGDARLAGVDAVIWGVEEDKDNPGGRYRRVATLRSVSGLSPADVAVYDYDCDVSGFPGFRQGLR